MTHIAGHMNDELNLRVFQARIEPRMRAWLLRSERGVDVVWHRSREQLVEFALRPAKRVRPLMLASGYCLARGSVVPDGVVDFAVGLELLHAFMLVHDDVADRAATRRGGPSLQVALGGGHEGDSKAVVAGDYLYTRALEAMLSVPGANEATKYMLEVCRYTAVGQHLDLALGTQPLASVRLAQTLQVAKLKTARYGFVAPLVCGAILGGGSGELIAGLESIGANAGLAYQLRDDVLGLFGDEAVSGKGGGADFFEGKRTFPVVAAWRAADAEGRKRLEAWWNDPPPDGLSAAREEVIRWGGLQATERMIERLTGRARTALAGLPVSRGAPALDLMLGVMARRAA